MSDSFISLCLKIPNLGTIAFYLIFVIGIPLYLINQKSTDSFKYYFPFLVMLAITLTQSGKPHMFQELYPVNPDTLNSLLSVSIIDALAVSGLLFQCITMSMYFKSIELGVVLGLITFGITFPIAQYVLPYFIREGDRFFTDIGNKSGFRYPGNWHRYFLGFSFILILLALEYFLIVGVSDHIVSGKSLFLNNNNNSNNNKNNTNNRNNNLQKLINRNNNIQNILNNNNNNSK